ncbi:HAD family hydrolase [Flagellimonas oceanensis]|uniref:HAD family hydrolase n=1 Tax=Flagellimonas oceanensis TaxID=2499163 RepID=UPI003BAB042F
MDIKVDKNTVVVFDLDDTLYNEIEYLKSAYKYIAKQLDANNWKRLYIQMFSDYRSGKNVFELVNIEYKTKTTDLLDIYRNHVPDISPFPGVTELFEKIKIKGGKIAIVTDGRSITQRNKIKSLGIDHHVDYTVISEEIGSTKPNKRNFTVVEDYFDLSNYCYIADNANKDFDAPNVLGWKSILVADNGLNIHTCENLPAKINQVHPGIILNLAELKVI